MGEGVNPTPKDIQFRESLNHLRKKSGSGVFLPGIHALETDRYPTLSSLCPWKGNPELRPDSLWIYVTVAPDPKQSNINVYRISISTSKRTGFDKDKSGIYDQFTASVQYSEDGKYLAQTIKSKHSPSNQVSEQPQTEIVLEGEATPPLPPDEGFMDLFLEFTGLVNDWKRYVDDTKDSTYYQGSKSAQRY